MTGRITVGVVAFFVAAFPAQESIARQDAPGIGPELLIDPDVEFPRVPETWHFEFPNDHSAHAGYRTEVWSFSGALRETGGELIGIRLTILRLSMSPEPVRRGSTWATTQVYFGLLSVSDSSSNLAVSRQRTSRAALALAGAAAEPFKLWLESWHVAGNTGASGDLNAQIDLRDDEIAVKLALSNSGPLADSNGLVADDSKGALPFIYYVQPFMNAQGTVDLGGGPRSVTGKLLLEHAWGEVPLPGSAVERDRFSLFLNDGRVLQVFRTAGLGQSMPATIEGVIFATETDPVLLSNGEVTMTATEHWTSRNSNRKYAVSWSLAVPDHDIELELEAAFVESEVEVRAPAWFGALRVRSGEEAAAGTGLMELVGQ